MRLGGPRNPARRIRLVGRVLIHSGYSLVLSIASEADDFENEKGSSMAPTATSRSADWLAFAPARPSLAQGDKSSQWGGLIFYL